MSNLRWLKKADGTKVLQESVPDVYDKWVDVPTIEEPKQRKELWEVLRQIYDSKFYEFGSLLSNEQIKSWKEFTQAARDYIKNERKEGGKV